MKVLIFIFVVCFITILEGRKCYFSANGTPKSSIDCDNGVDYCLEIDCIISGTPLKYQGCGNSLNVTGIPNGFPSGCTEAGTKTLSGSGLTGQYDCCNDKDLCNDKTLDPNAIPATDLTTVNTVTFTVSNGSTDAASASTAPTNTSIPTSTTVISTTSNFVERSFCVSIILLSISAAIYI